MFRSLSSKNSASSSKRKKADQSSRRPESVASSSTHRKHPRNDERSSKTHHRNSTSTQSPMDGSSGPSSYYTTSDRLHQPEPRSLTEEAIRSLSMQDDGWGDTYSHAEDLPPGGAHADKDPRSKGPYKDEAGRRYNEGLEHHSPAEKIEPDERSFSYGDYSRNSFGTSSHVQDQFPGQDPSTFARSSFDPTAVQGAAATYYNGDQVRPTPSSVNQFSQSGAGAAAEYYSQPPMQPLPAGNQHSPTQAFNTPQNTFGRPTEQAGSFSSPAYPANLYTTGPTDSQSNVNAATDLSDQNYTYQQPYRPTEAFVQEDSTSHETYHQHSQSVPSATTYTDENYYTPVSSQLPAHGKQAWTSQNLPYVAAAGAAAAAGAQSHHHKMHHHTHSAPIGNNNSGKMYSPPRPYTSGNMAMQHKHKGPISKFVDWWKDYEDVRKMEEYTEYIGVCKYCFDPRSTATDAPRKHHHGGRRSSNSLRRRSSDSLRRSYTTGSKYGRIDKDARYHSSDSERRSKKTSWLGAGVAAYGISKVGKSLWQNSRDFDDTYSVKSGRKIDASRRREATRNSSSGHESRSERMDHPGSRYDNSSDRFETDTQRSVRRPGYTRAETTRSQDGRYNSVKPGSVSIGGSRHSQEQIHVRHPSPVVGDESQHPSRRGYKSRSRSQSPSLAQILGLSSSQKRTSATASRSSSPQQGGMFTGFFSTQPSRSKSKQSKKNGFFNFANSSSSSADSGLAFGNRPSKNGKVSRRATRKSTDEHLKATLLGIGATAAALSAIQRGKSGSRMSEPTRPRNQDVRYTTQRSKRDTSEEDGWESATDDESISSGLAFGDFDGKVLRRQRSSESITSQSSGTDKWSWRWRRKPTKKATTNDMSQIYHEDTYSGKEPSVVSSQPLQYVHPVPISSPMHSEAHCHSSMPGAFPEQQYASECTSIQQPQPVMPVQSNILGNQTPPHASHIDYPSLRVFTRPTIPTELRRTQSSPVSSHTMRNAAIAGLAGAAAAGILSNGKSRTRDDSPSNVRFELTEKQAKKEERQQRKDDAKESRERAKVEARENKERARLDRERALKEESDRVTAENARRCAEEAERQKLLAEQAERHQVQLREIAAAEAREREEDRQREEEIKEFMKNALAEQAREAEAKKQREAWEAYQITAARQVSPPNSRAGPSTTSPPAVDRSQGYYVDQPQQDGNISANMPYATRSYEPSNEHSGQPLMDDDLIDPDFFTRRRSHSELARHEELARKAAAKIVADLESRYKDPAPSQAEFFAPKELFEPSKGKTKVHGPIDDTDYHVYRMSEDQSASMPNEPPPPYQPSYQFANLQDLKSTAPWDIPKLNVIAPTPPASYAGSAKGDKSPISASKKTVRELSQTSDADNEPQKSSKVSWGEDQTRFYEITTPQSSQEQIVSELPYEEAGSRTEYAYPESAHAEFSNSRNVTDDTNFSKDQADEPIEEISREPPFTSAESFYQQPFVESVSDIAFTMDSPGTEGAPPVQGFIEGEIDDADEIEDRMPHVPGGFEDTTPDPQPENTFNTDIQNLSREVMQEQQAPHPEPSRSSEQDQDDYFMTKGQRRKRDKEARRSSLDQNRDRQSPVDDQNDISPMHQTHPDLTEDHTAPKQHDSTSRSGLSEESSNVKHSSGYAVAGAIASAAAAVGSLLNSDSSRSATRRMSEPEVDSQRENRSESQSRDTVSQSTPTSPVYERRPSLPSHAFDDLDMLPGSKRPKKSKRNSLLNYPTIGSPLRSAMTWDEYIEPLDATRDDKPARSQSDETHEDFENPVEDTKTKTRNDLPSPESERGAASVVSAPTGDEDSGRRRKSRKSHREREESTSPRRSVSVAMSEPYESSRKHKRRSHRDDDDFEDAPSARSRSSHSSKRDDDDSRSKKKGGILSLFRRKTSDDVLSDEKKRTNGDDERSKHHRRRHSSEHVIDEFNERRGSTSRSSSHAEKDEASSRHSSSSRHRRRHHHDDGEYEDDASSQVSESRRRHKHRSKDHSRSPEKEFDDTQSQTSDSRRKHRHRDRDLDDRRSLSRDSKTIKDEDKSFLVERVEDEEPIPLPEDDILSSSQAPESVEQPQEPIPLSEDGKVEAMEQPHDSTTSPTVPDESKDSSDVAVQEDTDGPIQQTIEARSSPPPSDVLSPHLEPMTPARPIVPLRISSSTAVPLRFRRPPTSPGLPRERSASFSSSVAQSPSSPITPKAKRPLSTEFMHSTEFRPLYLLERTRKPQDQETEQNLPSLPPSRSASSSSLQSSEDWQSAAEDFEPGEQDNSNLPEFDQFHTDEPEDVLGSAQTTPKATEFPQNVLESRPHLEPEYYTWSDMEREEHLRQEAESEHRNESKEEPALTGDDQTEAKSAEDTILPNTDTEVAVNQDPMATDVWGDMSDEELPGTVAPVHEDSAEPVTQSPEPEAGSNLAASNKKRKNKNVAKLGTSSVSEITSRVRENPAELARRREKDAQDAVDTWFKPDSKPSEEALIDASLVPLPEPTTPAEAEILAPAQESEVPVPELEPGSPLLSRKKSKKGKKKQKSVILDEPGPELMSVEEPSEPQMVAEVMPEQVSLTHIRAKNEVEEDQTSMPAKETAQEQEFVLAASETVSPTEAIVESATPVDTKQFHDNAQIEEPNYTMSKAERKKNKKKKAKKAALSIAVPAVAAAVLATSEEHNNDDLAAEPEPALAKDREDESLDKEMPGDAMPLAEMEPSSEIDTTEQQVAVTEPMSPSLLQTELPPEQVALPQETQNEMTELEAIDPIPEPATESTPVPEAPFEEQARLVSEEPLDERPRSPPNTVSEATSKRLSWFSWLPGSKTQTADESKAESQAPEHEPEEPNALTQEPFERLLEQPMHHPEFIDASSIIPDDHKELSESDQRREVHPETDAAFEENNKIENPVENTGLPINQPRLEENAPPETEASADNTEDVETVESATFVAQDNLPSVEATSSTSEHAPAKEESSAQLPDSSAAEAPDNVLGALVTTSHAAQEQVSAPTLAEEPESAEDSWAMPSKKSKKGKKAKKAAKEKALAETASPSIEDRSLDIVHIPNDNPDSIESDRIEVVEPEYSSNVDTQGSTVNVLTDEPAPATSLVDDTGLSSTPTAEATGRDDSFEAISQLLEPAAKSPKVAGMSVQSDSQYATPGENKQVGLREPVPIEPSTATAGDEWAMPSSKKKKKKGKKGKQPLIEVDEKIRDVSTTQPPELQSPEVPAAIEHTPVTPDVFETPAEDSSAQYFATPADELADQYFVTPVEESPEQHFAVSADEAEPPTDMQPHEADSMPHDQLRRLSVTPTQATIQDESAVLIEKPLPLESSDHTDTTANDTTREVDFQPDAEAPVFDDSKDGEMDLQDESKPLEDEQVFEPGSEPTLEPSTTATQIEPIDKSASTPEIEQPKASEVHLDSIEEGKFLSESEASQQMTSANSEPGVLDRVSDQFEPQDDAEPQDSAETGAFATISKKSKKDKKKAKKAKQQQVESESFQIEAGESDSQVALGETVELPAELAPETSVTNDTDVFSAQQQSPEIKAVIEEQPVARKLSKKEKRKAKKAAVSGQATPFEDTPEQTPIIQDATSYFPESAEHVSVAQLRQVELSDEPQTELLSTPLDNLEEAREDVNNLSQDQNEPEELPMNPANHSNIDREEENAVQPHVTDRYATTDAASAAKRSESTEGLIHETEPAPTDLGKIDILPTENDLVNLADPSHDAQTDDLEISPQPIEPEPADVKDQAPGILDQLILAEEPALIPDSELVNDDESPVDIPLVGLEDHTAPPDSEHTLAEPTTESLGREEPVSRTETVAEDVEEPTAKDEPELEQESVQDSAPEERSQAVADQAPLKMSKKDKRKAKKLQQTVEPTLESSNPDEPSVPVAEEDFPTLTTADQETTETTDDIIPDQPTEDIEPFTAKLSKKAKKKAKKAKAKNTGMDVEEDDPSSTLRELVPDLPDPSNEDRVEESVVEPSQTPSAEPLAHTAPDLEQGLVPESTAPLDRDFSQDSEVAAESAPKHTVDSQELTETTPRSIENSEHALISQHVNTVSAESAAKDAESPSTDPMAETVLGDNLAKVAVPHSGNHDKPEIVEAPEAPRAVDSEVPSAGAPDHNEIESLADNEQSTAQTVETPMPEDKDEFCTMASTSKKNKKKGKKAKFQQETIVSEVLDDKSLLGLSNDPQKSVTQPDEIPQDMPIATIVENTVQPTTKEEPSTVLADEWELPTKKSKKEKRKANKLQNFEDDLARESIKQQPVVEPAVTEEVEETSAPPTSQAVDSESSRAEPESVINPDANGDWNFSRKLTKKEKRKARNTSFVDGQQIEPEPAAIVENTSGAQDSHSVDQAAASSKIEAEPEASGKEELLSAAEPVDTEGASTEPVIRENEALPAKDNELASALGDTSQDIDFAATLAAGLQDSGFDPNLVIEDPVFHRRASPTSVGEADPGEVTTAITRRPKRNTGQSGSASPVQDISRELSVAESSQPAEGSTNDVFSDTLTAGLIASGFATDALNSLSADTKDAQAEPEEFSFAISKRKKNGKKGKRVEAMTPEAPAPTDKQDFDLSEGDTQNPTPAETDVLPAQDPKQDHGELASAERSIGGPTDITTTRSAKPTFFHTSEVSQFLPVSIDHPVQSSTERVDQAPQQSADESMIETLARDIPRPRLEDAHATSITDSLRPPVLAGIHNEPATWSFDNLESPELNSGQAVHENEPFVSSNPTPEGKERIGEAEPISPVDSTTKDRTSYLFQSAVDVTGFDKVEGPSQATNQKQTRFYEPGQSLGLSFGSRPQTPPAPLPPSPPQASHIPLPPVPSRMATPPAPLPPSPSNQQALSPAPLPPNPQPDQSPPLTGKKSLYDIGSPGPGHSSKAARRSATPQQTFRAQLDEEIPVAERSSLDDRVPVLRPVDSNRSMRSNREQIRSTSSASSHSAAPSLRRINRSLSGDLRAASRRRGDGPTHGPPTTIPIEPPPTPPLQDEEFNGHGASRPSDMANIYEGWGDVRSSPTVSPTRPPSMRKRQSMHILDLEAKLDQLASENRYLQDAIDQTTSTHPPVHDNVGLQDMLRTRDLQLQEKDAEIQQIRSLLEPLQREIAKLTEVNNNLSEVNRSFTANNHVPYATLQSEHSQAHRQLQQTSQELDSLKRQHHELSDNMEDIVRQEISNALEDKNAEIRKLREELDVASQQIRLLQSEILASKGDSWLTIRDEDYFDTSCQKLCQHVQQWVLRFSKYSDNRMCRLTSDLTDEKIAARLDNAILDGSDVDKLLGDRVRRRDVFMSVVMTMIWEYVFTRYLFGMDREQRQKLKSLEKILSEVGPARAVAQWRATTLTLLSRRPAFATQRNLDTEAVAQEIFSVLSALLPPPAQLEAQILTSLRNVLRVAVELSIEMRSQKAEYIMLPPLQPEYDTQGDLVRKVHFNAALMNERSGDYTSNDELERSQAVVKIVLFPLVVKKGDDFGEGEDEIVVCPAQVLVAGSKQGKKVVRVLSGAMDIDNPRQSNQSIISGLESGGMI
ncbi:hypothetical protein E4T50_01156 [Aureobasidium sp. EXF-12298]|nr:hypothetical protein E4T50_01156 [Aureobasidium sp. EXF-12298]